jgi:hypothetical protein
VVFSAETRDGGTQRKESRAARVREAFLVDAHGPALNMQTEQHRRTDFQPETGSGLGTAVRWNGTVLS